MASSKIEERVFDFLCTLAIGVVFVAGRVCGDLLGQLWARYRLLVEVIF